MKKPFIALSSLTLLMGLSVALAQGWKQESFPPFEAVDTNKDGKISMDEAKAHPGTVEAALKSFFSKAHEQDKNKPYGSPITKKEWEGMTND